MEKFNVQDAPLQNAIIRAGYKHYDVSIYLKFVAHCTVGTNNRKGDDKTQSDQVRFRFP